eukprot:5386320-Prymnesium_polylepis.1
MKSKLSKMGRKKDVCQGAKAGRQTRMQLRKGAIRLDGDEVDLDGDGDGYGSDMSLEYLESSAHLRKLRQSEMAPPVSPSDVSVCRDDDAFVEAVGRRGPAASILPVDETQRPPPGIVAQMTARLEDDVQESDGRIGRLGSTGCLDARSAHGCTRTVRTVPVASELQCRLASCVLRLAFCWTLYSKLHALRVCEARRCTRQSMC